MAITSATFSYIINFTKHFIKFQNSVWIQVIWNSDMIIDEQNEQKNTLKYLFPMIHSYQKYKTGLTVRG